MGKECAILSSEHLEQAKFVQWFKRTYKDVMIFAIPNGGSRSISEACRLKVEGVTKGIPDLFCPAYLLWVEMKREKGSVVSKEQKEIKAYLEGIGHKVIIGKGFEDAKQQTLKYFIKN